MTGDDRSDRTDGIEAQLRRLLERLDRLGSVSEQRTIEGDSYTIDVDIGISSLDRAGHSPREPPRNRHHQPRRRLAETGHEYHVACHADDDAATVTVDLGSESDTPPAVEVEDGTLVLRADDVIVETVAVPIDDPAVVDTSMNNGILEIRLEATANGGDDGA